ncbi:MAG: PfkB family carbohydrate kinase [Anaerolineaceae bacterium]
MSLNHPGGSLLYAAAGHALLNKNVGLVAKTNPYFIEEFYKDLVELQADLKGITTVTHPINDRAYYRILSRDRWETTNLKRHFYELGCEIPKFLLEIENQKNNPSFKQAEDLPLSSADFPSEYAGAKAILLTPLCFRSHFSCIPFLRAQGVQNILIRSSPSYMIPSKLSNLPKLLSDIDFFFTTEQEIRTLFSARIDRYQTMLEILKVYGAAHIIIKNKSDGYLLMHAEDQILCQIPDYSVYTVDPIGEYDCFCGIFTACLLFGNLSLEECASKASAAASVCREGSGIAHILNTYPAIYRLRAELIAHDITYSTISSLSDSFDG